MDVIKFLEKNTRSITRPVKKMCKWAYYDMGLNVAHSRFVNSRINKIIKSKNVKYIKIRNKEDYYQFEKEQSELLAFSRKYALDLKNCLKYPLEYSGVCIACGRKVKFSSEMLYEYSQEPMLSETIVCPKCGLSNRVRQLFYILYRELPLNKKLSIFALECVTPFYKSLESNFGYRSKIIASEFLGGDLKSGEVVNGILHEDATSLSFENNSFDAVVSNHVYEHVADIDKTLSEAYRVLKVGGKVIAGIPIDIKKDKTFVRAKIEDGQIVYLAEKEIHGNPLSDSGCLCFYNYGWDLFEKFKKAGFKDVYLLNILSKELGNVCDYPVATFVAVK